MLTRILVVALLVFPANSFAGEPWDKPAQDWTLAETYQVLTDSPWSPSKSRIEISWAERRLDPLTRRPSDSPIAMPNQGMIVRTEVGRRTQPDVTVLWWSAKTTRLAQQRLRQLRSTGQTNEPLRAEPMSDFVLVVEGAEPLRILRDAEENLKESVFLETPGGLSLDVAEIRFVEGEKAGEDRVEFHFPRQIESRPTISADASQVVFHCKATAKNPRPGRQNALAIRATFEPRKMRAAAQSDL